MPPCANTAVAIMNPVSLAYPTKETSLSLVCAADFSIQVVSDEFVGKVRS